MSISTLLVAAREGDQAALGHLLINCRDYLLFLALRGVPEKLQPKFGASDVVQDTLFEAHRDFKAFQGNSQAELLGWIRRILSRNMSNLIRTYRTAKRATDREVLTQDYKGWHGILALEPDPGAIATSQEEWKCLEAALQRMPPENVDIIRRRHLLGQTFESMAQQLGRSADAVRRQWATSIAQLRMELKERTGTDDLQP